MDCFTPFVTHSTSPFDAELYYITCTRFSQEEFGGFSYKSSLQNEFKYKTFWKADFAP